MVTTEPDWADVQKRMSALTLKQLKPVKAWFNGNLGGASTKAEVIQTMTNQMRYWWRNVEGGMGKSRVRHVMEELEKAERGE